MSDETINLNDLKDGATEPTTPVASQFSQGGSIDASTVQEVDPNSIIAPPKDTSVQDANTNFMGDIFAKVDAKVEAVRQEAVEFHEGKDKYEFEKDLENENKDETDINDVEDEPTTPHIVTPEPPKNITTSSLNLDENDFKDLDDEDEISDDRKATINEFKKSIKEKLKPITNVIDISSFTISKAPVSVAAVLNTTVERTINWVMPADGRSYCLSQFRGYDVERLNPQSSGANRLETYKRIFGTIYDKIVDANKPQTLEQWAKLVNFFDLNHLYFGIYKSCYEKDNLVPYSCTNKDCNNSFIQETVIDTMVKYKDEATKQRMLKLLEADSTTSSVTYDVETVQVSDDYVIGFREPSVFNVVFENAVLDEKFTAKYSDLLSVITYIDSIYFIDRENKQLKPVELKIWENNLAKTVKYKVKMFAMVLKTLSSDQLKQVEAYIEKINERHDEITYVLPEIKCPKCGHTIEEVPQDAEGLLFTRHQLVDIANSTTR